MTLAVHDPHARSTGRRKITIDEFMAMPDHESYDLRNGRLVERPMGAESEWIAGNILTKFNVHLDANPIGYAFNSGVNYRALEDADHSFNRPDVSFVVSDKVPDGDIPEGYMDVWPDLAVEVISPTETGYDTNRKVEEFLAGGTRLVLVIDPQTRRSLVHRPDGTVTKLTDADVFDGEDVLPGLKVRMADVLPRKKK